MMDPSILVESNIELRATLKHEEGENSPRTPTYKAQLLLSCLKEVGKCVVGLCLWNLSSVACAVHHEVPMPLRCSDRAPTPTQIRKYRRWRASRTARKLE